jgi:selenocysteine-specific elongation factor
VVTGTLQDGCLRVGQEVQIYPGDRRARIRSLQSHKLAVEEGRPGGRMAANLVGIATTEVTRGNVLALPGSLRPTIALDARLEVITDAPHPLLHNSELEVYSGAAEVPGRVLLLDSDQLRPGETGWAQLRLARPLALVRGDRFILRIPSPGATIGGGIVVDPWAVRHRRHDPAVLLRLEQLGQTDPEQVVLATLQPLRPINSSRGTRRLGRYHLQQVPDIAVITGLSDTEIEVALSGLVARAQVVRTGTLYMLPSEWARLSTDAVTLVTSYHQRFPLRAGMPREEWRSRLDLSARAAEEVLVALAESRTALETVARATDRGHGVIVRLRSYQPQMTDKEGQATATLLERFRRDPWNPPTRPEVELELGSELTTALIDQGKLVRVSDVILLDPDTYTQGIDLLVSYLHTQQTITAAQARDLLHSSRKYVLAFLEHLDARHITRRQGDDRVLGPRAPETGSAVPALDTDG